MSINQRIRSGALALLALAAAGRAPAQSSERYSLQGFGGWAFGDTNNDNRFGYVASDEGEWNNYYFALNVAARPMDKLSIRAQAFWGEDLRGKRIELDYAFAQWEFSPALKFRVGKTPVPFGIYSEVYDVGTLRPFYLLPQFYEGPLGLIPKAYVGAGLTGVKTLGDRWELQYDAFGGEIGFEEFTVDTISFDEAGQPVVNSLPAQVVASNLVGGRALLAAPDKGLDFGGSVFYSPKVQQRIDDGPRVPYSVTDTATFVNLRAQYQKDRVGARAEWFAALTRSADVKSFYVEASYKLDRHWQLAAQYENSDIVLLPGDESVPEPLRRHESVGLALNYWVSPELVLKLNGYRVDGNMIAQPLGAGLRAAMGTIEEPTNVVVVGAQFSF